MFHFTNSHTGTCLPVSLWYGTEFLGWFRARDIDQTGMLISGPVKKLADNSIVTVAIELQQQDGIVTHQVKALVMHPTYNEVELWWANQHAEIQPLLAISAQQYA